MMTITVIKIEDGKPLHFVTSLRYLEIKNRQTRFEAG